MSTRDWSREPWRKLYTRESLQKRLWPVLCRSFRDYLLRFAEDDGTLIVADDPVTALTASLSTHADELETVKKYIQLLLADGYLVRNGKRLGIRSFAEAQTKQSKQATRQARYIANKKARETGANDAPADVSSDAPADAAVTSALTGVLTSQTIRDETKRDDTSDALTHDPPPSLEPDPEKPRRLALDFELHPLAVSELAKWSGFPESVILAAVDEFKSYWIIGGGRNKPRTQWQAKCRDDIRHKHETGALAAIARRLGETSEPSSGTHPLPVATADDVLRMTGN